MIDREDMLKIKKAAKWCFIKSPIMFYCEKCKGEYDAYPLSPIPAEILLGLNIGFVMMHKDCGENNEN